MKKTIKVAVALACSAVFAQITNAAVMTRTYTSVARYDRGPISVLRVATTVTFDPVVAGSASLVLFTGSDSAVFNNVAFEYFLKPGFAAFGFGGGPDGVAGQNSQNNDFDWMFILDDAGEVVDSGYLTYSKPGLPGILQSALIVTTANLLTSAIPEPATWAMMLMGFGMTAAAARGRRRATKFACA